MVRREVIRASRQKKELQSIALNLDSGIETASAYVEELRDDKPINRQNIADAFEAFLNTVKRENGRLRKVIR